VDDVVRIEQQEHRLCELVDHALVEKAMGYIESRIAFLLALALQRFVEVDDLGVVTTGDAMFRLPGDLVRMPDVAFTAWERFPEAEIPLDPAPAVVPDLAVEVLSPGNTPGEMARKLREYFRAGVRLVWLIDPQTKTVRVHTSPTRSKRIPETGTLDGGKVLAGFKLPVASLFARRKRRTKRSK
jgi:Uma2 family endonuclease